MICLGNKFLVDTHVAGKLIAVNIYDVKHGNFHQDRQVKIPNANCGLLAVNAL